LRAEGLTPLRGLWAYRFQMSAGNPELTGQTLAVLTELTGAMISGTYEQWLFEGPVPDEQLRGLDAAQRLLWRTADTLRHEFATMTPENGVERMWVTKIGGPSHGFDHGPGCLLPFLANAYTTAILVDDPRYPDNAAARCCLRLLHAPDGPAGALPRAHAARLPLSRALQRGRGPRRQGPAARGHLETRRR
jgi:hypothetical protein